MRLPDAGITNLVFTKRFTLNANPVYTEYVNSKRLPGGNICILNLETGGLALRCDQPQYSTGDR